MVYRVEGEVCSPEEKRVITGEEIQAQAKPETAEKSSSIKSRGQNDQEEEKVFYI